MKFPEIIYLEEIGSTNDYLKNAIRKGDIVDNTIVITNYQTKGKGRGNNVWISECKKNLTFSICHFLKDFNIEKHFYITKMVSLSLVDYLQDFVKKVTIKWPNDIYIGDNKLAGILIETSLFQDTIQNCVIGIGMNINQTEFDNSLPNPVSLAMISGKTYGIKTVMEDLLKYYCYRYSQLVQEKYSYLDQDYNDRLYKRGAMCTIYINEKLKEVKVLGVSQAGLLRVEDENGQQLELDYNEVVWGIV